MKTWPALLAVFYLSQKFFFGPLLCDDAFITLAHARSFAHGVGLIASGFNPVDASSAPLYALLLGTLGYLFGDGRLETFAYLAGWTGEILSLFLVYALGRRLGFTDRGAGLAASVYASCLAFHAVGASGMETPLYIALALWGHFDLLKPGGPGRTIRIVALLAPVWRPEGILLSLVLALLAWKQTGRLRDFLIAGFAGGVGIAILFGIHYWAWGHLLPNSVLAKQAGVRIGVAEGLFSWLANLILKGPMLGGAIILLSAEGLAMALALAGYFPLRKSQAAWMLLPWPALYFSFFLFSGASYRHFPWYFSPPLPFLILWAAAGWKLAMEKRGWNGFGSLPALWAIPGLLLFAAFTAHRLEYQKKHHRAQVFREERYARAAAFLDSVGTPGKVLMDEVGVFAYRGHFPILDFHGLISPEAIPFVRKYPAHGPRLLALKEAFHPDWIAWSSWGEPGQDTLYGEYSELQKEHELIRVFREPGSPHALHLWKRKAPP